MGLSIFINNSSGVPLYEQVKEQIIEQIISGELKPDEGLPSMRALATDIGVSMITTKRAYEDLCREGFLYSSSTKGVFVSKVNLSQAKKFGLKVLEAKVEDIVAEAKKYGISSSEISQLLEKHYED